MHTLYMPILSYMSQWRLVRNNTFEWEILACNLHCGLFPVTSLLCLVSRRQWGTHRGWPWRWRRNKELSTLFSYLSTAWRNTEGKHWLYNNTIGKRFWNLFSIMHSTEHRLPVTFQSLTNTPYVFQSMCFVVFTSQKTRSVKNTFVLYCRVFYHCNCFIRCSNPYDLKKEMGHGLLLIFHLLEDKAHGRYHGNNSVLLTSVRW